MAVNVLNVTILERKINLIHCRSVIDRFHCIMTVEFLCEFFQGRFVFLFGRRTFEVWQFFQCCNGLHFSTYCLQILLSDLLKRSCFLANFRSFIFTYFFLSQIDEDLTARVNMADAKFSFQEKGRVYYPAWMSPEGKLITRK